MSRSWWKYWLRKGHVRKKRVEQYHSIDSASLYDNRSSYPFEEGDVIFEHGHHVTLFADKAMIRHSGDSCVSYNIPVVTTPCTYGGKRHWFLCPNSICHRRSKKLYINSQGTFLCRKCLNLAYKSQNRSKADRIIDKKWYLIHKFNGDSDWNIQKPKRMHQKTFDRVQEQIYELDNAAMNEVTRLCGGDPYTLLHIGP